ncbi:hypothetical protein EON83_03935 [bacterium]|nr:MAG: hypothetical protein EON83_03935 [bacterium]
MLLAPNDPTSTPSRSEPRLTAREEVNFNYALMAICAGLLTFSLISGIGLINGRVPVERAYILMTPIPLALAIWFAMGAFRARPTPDIGLLLTCVGWACVLFTLVIKHAAVQSALAANIPLSQVSDGALVWMLAVLALISLGAGAWLSWQKARETGLTS